jgi:hypothetical protein
VALPSRAVFGDANLGTMPVFVGTCLGLHHWPGRAYTERGLMNRPTSTIAHEALLVLYSRNFWKE